MGELRILPINGRTELCILLILTIKIVGIKDIIIPVLIVHQIKNTNTKTMLSGRNKYIMQKNTAISFVYAIFSWKPAHFNVIKNNTRSFADATGTVINSADQILLYEGLKYAVVIVASLPVMCLYPFLQRYFVKGTMVGAVKG